MRSARLFVVILVLVLVILIIFIRLGNEFLEVFVDRGEHVCQ